MAVLKGAVPWWGLGLNWLVGEWGLRTIDKVRFSPLAVFSVTFGNLVGSLFFAAIITKCTPAAPSPHSHTP